LIERTREQGGDTVDALCAVIGSLFEDKAGESTPCVVLCSGHKSKGREWDRVHLLGLEELQPARTSRDWQARQEVNLMYVMVTRAKAELFIVGGVKEPK
jgi:superfamily I DNA/RNA helicase